MVEFQNFIEGNFFSTPIMTVIRVKAALIQVLIVIKMSVLVSNI